MQYSYSEIKKMTTNFQKKLGQGGYGSVYKRKLQNGLLVAVKVLGNITVNGKEFIKVIATIGRMHRKTLFNSLDSVFKDFPKHLFMNSCQINH